MMIYNTFLLNVMEWNVIKDSVFSLSGVPVFHHHFKHQPIYISVMSLDPVANNFYSYTTTVTQSLICNSTCTNDEKFDMKMSKMSETY